QKAVRRRGGCPGSLGEARRTGPNRKSPDVSNLSLRASALGVHAAERPQTAPCEAAGLGAEPNRPLPPGPARGEGPAACTPRRPAHAPPPGALRPDRPPADAGRAGRLHGRRLPGRLRQGGGPAAGLSRLWRALGPSLARPGSLLRRLPRNLALP